MNRGTFGSTWIAILLVGVCFLGAMCTATADETAIPNRELFSVPAHGGYHTVAFSPDGKQLAAGATNNRLMIWDADSGKELRTLVGHRGDLIDVTFSPDGKWLASSGREGARVWEAATGAEAFVIQGKGWVSRVAFSPDGKRLAAAGPSLIALWDVAEKQEVNLLKGHQGGVSCVVYSPDGKFLASAGTDKTVRLWDSTSGRELLTLPGHASPVHAVAFSPDGKCLASASLDKTVRLWDSGTGNLVRTLTGHGSGVHAVAYSPDGRRVASAGQDRTIKLWDASTGQEILTLTGHTGPIHSVVFSPDGRRLASTGSDATVRVWTLDAPERAAIDLSPAQMDALWDDLGSDHAGKSFRAILTLSAAPKLSVPFLERRLKPVSVPSDQEKRLAQLLVDLDDDRFVVRQRATAELEKMEKLAEPALRGLLEERPSLEVRQRVERLLDRLKGLRLLPEQMLAHHGVEVLERIGTPEAREILESLAGGAPGHWLTQAAKASLQRLKPSPKATPSGR